MGWRERQTEQEVIYSHHFLCQTRKIYRSENTAFFKPRNGSLPHTLNNPTQNLNIPILNQIRRPIPLPAASDEIPTRGENGDPRKHDHAEIHRLLIHRRAHGEKAEDEKRDQEKHGDDVDRQAVFAEGELGHRKRGVGGAEAAGDEAADGEDVGGDEGGDGEGDDGVEGDRGAEVDEGDDDAEGEGDPERVEGDVPAWFDLLLRVSGGCGRREGSRSEICSNRGISRTRRRKRENGKPLSREKAQIWREAVATSLTTAMTRVMMMMAAIMAVATLLRVTL